VEKTGTRTWRRACKGLVLVLAVLGAVGCGDDDDGASGVAPGNDTGTGQAESSGDATGDSGAPADECTELRTSEVEAQFGEAGPVADAYVDEVGGCIWEIGDQEGFGEPGGFGGFFGLNTFRGDTSMSLEETFGSGESIQGLGDEAWLTSDANLLIVRLDDLHLSLTTSLSEDVEDARGKMVALAELVVDRV
jgi:hypothetical protein